MKIDWKQELNRILDCGSIKVGWGALGDAKVDLNAFIVSAKGCHTYSAQRVRFVDGRSRMNIPWLENDQQSSAERLQATAFELAGAIAGPFAPEDGQTFPEYKPGLKSRAIVRVSETD